MWCGVYTRRIFPSRRLYTDGVYPPIAARCIAPVETAYQWSQFQSRLCPKLVFRVQGPMRHHTFCSRATRTVNKYWKCIKLHIRCLLQYSRLSYEFQAHLRVFDSRLAHETSKTWESNKAR